MLIAITEHYQQFKYLCKKTTTNNGLTARLIENLFDDGLLFEIRYRTYDFIMEEYPTVETVKSMDENPKVILLVDSNKGR